MSCLRLIVFTLICFSSSLSVAQEDSKEVEKRKAQLEAQEEEKRRLAEEAHEEGIKKHMELQTKETRKRMKKNRRRANRNNDNRKEFFINRWFSYEIPENLSFFAKR